MANTNYEKEVELAENFLAKDDYKKAFRHYEKALSYSPHDEHCMTQRARMLYLESDVENLGLTPSVKKILKRSKTLADQTLRKYPKNPDVLFIKAMTCAGLEDYTNAIKYFEKTQKILPDENRIILEKADCLMWFEKYEKALAAYDLVLEKDHNNTEILSDKGFCLSLMKEHEKAIEVYKKILEIDPADGQAEFRSILPLIGLKRYDEVIEICNRFHNDKEADTMISWARAEALFGLTKFEEAIKVVDKMEPLDPTMHVGLKGFILDAFLVKGKCFEMMNKFEDAKKTFHDVIKKCKDKDNTDNKNDALEALGHINWMQEEYEKAKKYFSQLIKSNQLRNVHLFNERRNSKFVQSSLIHSKEGLEKLLQRDESKTLEFKSSLCHPYKARKEHMYDKSFNENKKRVTDTALKTICAFLNTNGGTLVFGVDDKKKILGIEEDFKYVGKHQNWDGWKGHLASLIRDRIGTEFSNSFEITNKTKNGKMVAMIRVRPSEKLAYLDPNNKKECAFYKRTDHGSDYCSTREAIEYISENRLRLTKK